MEGNPMRRRMIAAGAIFCLVVAVVWRYAGDSGTSPGDESGANSTEPDVPSTPGTADRRAAFVLRPPVDRGIKLGDPLFSPNSAEDVEWLRRNGYPSDEELRAGLNATPSALDLDIEDGISPAEVVMAASLGVMGPEQRNEATSFLNEAAVRGSVYALQATGEMLTHPAVANPVQSEAYLRASVLRGDWTGNIRTRAPLSHEQDLLASLMAQQVIDNIHKQRLSRGWPPLQADPRPGLNEVMDRIARSREPGEG